MSIFNFHTIIFYVYNYLEISQLILYSIMSKSNASAKNRRAFGGNPPPPTQLNAPQSQAQSATTNGFTLQQVIAVIDKRLVSLETFVNDTKENNSKKVHSEFIVNKNQLGSIPESDNSIQEVLNEFNTRFEILAEEIGTLKEIVLKLQSYTMDVNKTLLEERIHILSDLGSSTNQENEPQLFELIQNNNMNPSMESENVNTSMDLHALVKEEFSTNSE